MTQIEYWDKVFDMLSVALKPKEFRICKHCEHFKFPAIEIGAGCCGCKDSPRYGWWGTEESSCPMFKKLTIND